MSAMRHYHYVLDAERRPVPAKDVLEWSDMFGDHARRTVQRSHGDGWELVTLFFGLDIYGDGPVLFESALAINGGTWRQLARYDTWDEAQDGHKALVAKLGNCYD